MPRFTRIAVMSVLLLLAVLAWIVIANQGQPGGSASATEPCGLVAAYGGIFEVPAGSEVSVTADNREELLERVRACVEGQLGEEAKTKYQQLAGTLSGPIASREQRAERSFVQVELAVAISGTEMALQQRQVARRLIEGWSTITDIVERREAGGALRASDWVAADSRVAHRNDAPAYHQACRDAGVPVPGSFEADPGWSRGLDLDEEVRLYFVRWDWKDAEVRTYRGEGGGFCVALARRHPTDPEKAPYIGTICADRLQNNACFFDNIVYEGSDTRRIDWEDFKRRDFSEFVHPFDGEDSCNNCHLGQNPFIVHPKTKLGDTVELMYAESGPKRFEFVGLGGTWNNFDPIATVAADKCMKCHSIPHITKDHQFCSIIKTAANRTMPLERPLEPTGGPPFWPDDNGCFKEGLEPLKEYFASMVRLKSICTGEPEKTCNQD